MLLFWLKKIVSYWLMPFPLCLLLLCSGLILWWRGRHRRLGPALALAGVGLLLLFGNRALSNALLAPLERTYPALEAWSPANPPPPAVAACRYVVVLGGGNSDLPGRSPTNLLSGSSLARMVEGTRLALSLPGVQVITTGPAPQPGLETHAAVVRRAIVSLGVDPARCLIVADVRDTEDEALAVRSLVGDAPVLLVTSAWHLPRAVGLFRKAGVTVVPAPTDFQTKDQPWRWLDLGVDLDSLGRSTWAVREYLGLAWVRLRGKM